MPDLDTPDTLPRAFRSGVRSAALHLKGQQSRGYVAPTFWAGVPGLEHDPRRTAAFRTVSQGRGEELDGGTRLEIALALAQVVMPEVSHPHFWLTRSGDPDFWTADHDWLSAVRAACAELGIPRSFTLVTRTGWSHEPTGLTHRWKRLRA